MSKKEDNDPVSEKVCNARMAALETKIESIKWVIVGSVTLSTAFISLVLLLVR
jgi:hypothetical protein